MLFRKLTDAANYMPWLILALIAGVSIGYFGQAAIATHLGTLAGLFARAFNLAKAS